MTHPHSPTPSSRLRRKRRQIRHWFASRRHWRFLLASALGLLVLVQLVAFTPTRLERDVPPAALTEAKILEDVKVANPVATDRPGDLPRPLIPEDQVPDYSVDGFQFVSIQAGVKQWRIEAEHAFFYQKLGFVHARGVKAEIFDHSGAITHVTSQEAKYDLNSRDLELYTDVHTTFPEGMHTTSPYVKYDARIREIQVPAHVPIEGVNPATPKRDELAFSSYGLNFRQDTQIVNLVSRVRVESRHITPAKKREVSQIESDVAQINRATGLAVFRMDDANGAIEFVKISQPGMVCLSRRAEFRFGGARELRKVLAIEEVKITETPKIDPNYASDPRARAPTARRATAGIAEFDSERNVILLKEFPQVYQDHDTITGEVIIVHRGSDLVEVEQSNAFSEGTQPGKTGH